MLSVSSLINAGIALVNELKLEVSKLDAEDILSLNHVVVDASLLLTRVYGLVLLDLGHEYEPLS